MLRAVILLLLAQSGTLRHDCVEFEIWKGGDDGITNRIFDQIETYNKKLSLCNEGRNCRRKILLISTNIRSIKESGREIASVAIEIYKLTNEIMILEYKFDIECNMLNSDCAEKIYNEINIRN